MVRNAAFLLCLATPLLAQGFFGKEQDKKTHRELRDPLTGESFRQPLPRATEIAWTDRLLRPVATGEHPRLRGVWVSPYTGFATLPSEALWKRVGKMNPQQKAKIKNALADFPRKYHHVDAIPALHRYALALKTYRAIGMSQELHIHLLLQAAYSARDEGNVAEEAKYLRILRPIFEKRAENESITSRDMIRSGYLAGEIARVQGDTKAARRLFEQADMRIRRWKDGRAMRVHARLGHAEFAWAGKSDDELKAMLDGPDPTDRRVAALLLVDRGAVDAIAPLLKEKDKETVSLRFKKDLVHRAYTNPNPALVPALEPMLGHDDVFVATWAARALGRIGTPSAIQTLVRGLADEDQERLVEGLAASSSKEATKELARLAEEGSGFGARPKAARALLKRPGAVAADGLVRHVAVAESYNLSSALLVATKYGPTLEPRLVSALEAEKDAARLANLLRLAALIPSVNCVRIAAGHQQSSDPKVRLGAAAVRAQAGEGKSELASAFAGASGGDKIVILEALGHLGADSVLRASTDDKVRQDSPALFLVALKAAGRAKDKSLRTKLTKLLADPNPLVVASAAHGLVLMGEKKRVLALLESRQYTIVSAIARGLGETKDASAVSVLIDAYGADDGAWIGSEPGEGGPYDMPRQEIAAALRRIGGNDAEAFLKRIEG